MARRPFLQQVAENPRGWGEAPPPVDPQFAGTGELRSGNTPYGDLVATLMGPAAGPYASSFDRGMETASNLGAELTGIPQAARAGQSVEKALREFTPSNAGAAGRDVGLAALGAVPFGSAAARAGGAAIDRIAGALTGTGTKAAIGTAAAGGGLVGASDAAHAGNWEDLAGKVQKDVAGWFADPYKAPSRDEWMAKERARAPKIGDLDRMQAEAAARVRESDAYKALASQPQFATVAPNGSPLGRATVAKRSAALQAAQQGMVDAETARAKAAYDESKGTAETFDAGLPKRYDEMVADLNTRRAEESGRPFYERHPTAAAASGFGSVVIPAALGYRTMSNLSRDAAGITKRIGDARMSGDLMAEADALAENAAFPKAAATEAGMALAKGAATPPSLRTMGDAIDATFVPTSGDPQHPSAGDKASKKFTLEALPDYFATMVPGAAEGALETMSGAGLAAIMGKHIPLSAMAKERRYLDSVDVSSPDKIAAALAGPRAEALEANARIRPLVTQDARSAQDVLEARAGAAHSGQLADLRRKAEIELAKQPGTLPSPASPSPLPGSGPVAPASTSAPPAVPQGNSAPTSAGNQVRLPDDQYLGIIEALAGKRMAPGQKSLPPARTPAEDMRYFDPVAGAGQRSQAEIVRDFIGQQKAAGKKFSQAGEAGPSVRKALADAGAANPIERGQIGNRWRTMDELSKAHMGKPFDKLTEPEWNQFRGFIEAAEAKTGKGGKTLSIAAPLAAGAGASAYPWNDSSAAQSPSDDNPYRRIAQSLMGY